MQSVIKTIIIAIRVIDFILIVDKKEGGNFRNCKNIY